jgi:hypothetical protein
MKPDSPSQLPQKPAIKPYSDPAELSPHVCSFYKHLLNITFLSHTTHQIQTVISIPVPVAVHSKLHFLSKYGHWDPDFESRSEQGLSS